MQTNMTTGRPLTVILRFLLPMFIGNVFQQLYNMADTIIVGRFVGQGALAAVGSTGNIMFLVIGSSIGISAGFTVLTAQRYGADDKKGMRQSVSNAIILAVIAVAVFTGIFLAGMESILRIMNTPDDIFEDAYTYISIICGGLAVTVFNNMFSAFLRAVGNSKVPLFFLVFSACLNIVLDLVLIIEAGMGVAGAAYATVISQFFSAVFCWIYIAKKVPDLIPRRENWRLNTNFAKKQLIVGIPMMLQFAITASGTMVMQAAINLFGSTVIASYTAASKFQMLITQGMLSMGQTMATYTGQNFGRGDLGRIRAGVRAAVLTMIGYSLICALFTVLLMRPAMGLFFSGDTDLDVLMPYAKVYLYICAAFYIPLSFIFIFRNTMQGCGYGLLPMMGGVVELGSRVAMALAAMKLTNYTLAVSCDASAWFTAGLFTAVAYLKLLPDIRRQIGPENTNLKEK